MISEPDSFSCVLVKDELCYVVEDVLHHVKVEINHVEVKDVLQAHEETRLLAVVTSYLALVKRGVVLVISRVDVMKCQG